MTGTDAAALGRIAESFESIAQSLAIIAAAHPSTSPAPVASPGLTLPPEPAAVPTEPTPQEPSPDAEDLRAQAFAVCAELARAGANPSTSIQHHAGVSGLSQVADDGLAALVALLESELAQLKGGAE